MRALICFRILIACGSLCAAHWTPSAIAAPIAHLSRSSVTFGQTPLGTASPVQPVFTTNTGDAPLIISGLTVSGAQANDFVVSGTCRPAVVLNPGEQCRIDIVMDPASRLPASRAGTLTVDSNAVSPSADIALDGNVDPGFSVVVFQPTPEWVDFGTQSIGTASPPLTLNITNAVGSTFSIDQFVLLGGDTGDFAMQSNCAVGQSFKAHQTCTATITFMPQAAGPRSTELVTEMSLFGVHGYFRYSITGVSGSAGPAMAVELNQHGLTGSWYNPTTNGQGFELEVYPNHVAPGTGLAFVSWFAFDIVAGGAERQRWYTLQGNVVTGQPTSSLTIYQNTGGNFSAPPITTANPVGTAMLTFDSCISGVLTYTFTDGSGRTGSIPLTRLTQNVTCSTTSARPTNADFGFSGNWFDPVTSGQGFTVEVNPNSRAIFFAWYTYAPNGAGAGAAGQRWYTGLASGIAPLARSFPVQIYESTGGAFDASNPAANNVVVGSGTVAFQSCTSAALNYTFTGGSSSGASGTIALSRVGPVPTGCMQ